VTIICGECGSKDVRCMNDNAYRCQDCGHLVFMDRAELRREADRKMDALVEILRKRYYPQPAEKAQEKAGNP
jgi:DNA-directed RNA polymerase subunit RPC12/RpoP